MPTIKGAKRLVKEIYLLNLASEEGLSITPMLVAAAGIGKSQSLKKVASELSPIGQCITVEGGSLEAGEITGLPFQAKNDDGEFEVRFVLHQSLAAIRRLQREFYNKGRNEGFLNGTLKINEDGSMTYKDGKKEETYDNDNYLKRVMHGDLNKFLFGEGLPAELKIRLIEEKEISPVIFFVDELNRGTQPVMKELMNLILNKEINGYKIPWFVQIVSAVNPSTQEDDYATLELDRAQGDRFLEIDIQANDNEWAEYMMEKTLNYENSKIYYDGIVAMGDVVCPKDKKRSVTEQCIIPTDGASYRSREIALNILANARLVRESKLMTDEEKKSFDETDILSLISGKCSLDFSRQLMEALKNKDSRVSAKDLFDGKSAKISEALRQKYLSQKAISRYATTNEILKYFMDNWDDLAKKEKTDEKTFKNICLQIDDFFALMDNTNQYYFCGILADTKKCKTKSGASLLLQLSRKTKVAFEMLQRLKENDETLKKLNEFDNKA